MTRILIVEDDDLVAKAYKRKLELAKYEVEIAADGQEGLEKAKLLKPDLILLDILMPRLNGIEVLKQLKADNELKIVPIIVLTNLSSRENAEACLKEGCVSYIIKSSTVPSQEIGRAHV